MVEPASGTMDSRRQLPSVERLLQSAAAASLLSAHPRPLVADALRQVLSELRAHPNGPVLEATLVAQAGAYLAAKTTSSLTTVINATGVILHTNLGRAPLSAAAQTAAASVSAGYSTLEYDLETGQRGSRHEHLVPIIADLTGAESALVVNNNASAVLLVLAALAQGREVVISRGQLVEIGGGFRIPDVLAQSGAHLVEVGTTNRTYAEDYARALTPESALLLRVHSSNFRVTGFVHAASLADLAELAHARGILVVDDLGSGSLLRTETYGLAHEPMVQESIAAGADVVCFSGDKLLGGPQAGLIVGKRDLIERIKRHPLTRAVRPDKATLAALHATLVHYQRGEAVAELPVWRMIAASLADLETRANAILSAAGSQLASVVESQSTVGGGSLPGETLPSRAIALRPLSGSAQDLAARLRAGHPAIIGHIVDDRLLLDLRTVAPAEDELLIGALRGIATP